MTVLVTGASGFIGSHLVERLIANGAQVRCLMRPSSPTRFLPPTGWERYPGDLSTGAGLNAAVAGVETIFHVAGVTKSADSAGYHAGNVRTTENLLRACAETGIRPRLVHVSSLAAAGPSENGVPVRETAAPHPVSSYGRSKLEGEEAVRRSSLAEVATIVRPAVVYGPRDSDVLRIIKAANRGVIVRIGREESFFSLIHVRDLVEALLLAAGSAASAGNTYFLSNPDPVSWHEFGTTAAMLLGRKAIVLAAPRSVAYGIGYVAEISSRLRRRPGILSRDKISEASHRYWTCDPSRAYQDFGFLAPTSLLDGLKESIDWYRRADWLK
jgi:nucleoside-diphosphate-sugar epimerase